MKQRFIRIASSVAAVLLLAVGLIWLCHADPIEAFGYFCYGLFGSISTQSSSRVCVRMFASP